MAPEVKALASWMEPTQWKEKMDSYKLFSGLHVCAMEHVHSSTTHDQCFKQKIVWFGPMTLKIFQYNENSLINIEKNDNLKENDLKMLV